MKGTIRRWKADSLSFDLILKYDQATVLQIWCICAEYISEMFHYFRKPKTYAVAVATAVVVTICNR